MYARGPQAVEPLTTLDVASLTSLDPPETNPQPTDQTPPFGGYDAYDCSHDPLNVYSKAVDFRHSGWKRDRSKVYASFRRTEQAGSRLTSFSECGKNAYVYQSTNNPGEFSIGGSSCHDRFCLPCAQQRSRAIATNVLTHIEGKESRFVTLTLRGVDASLQDLLEKLSLCFTQLRRTKLWKTSVNGGVAFLEIKWSPDANRWHPHLHCLVQGKYIPQDKLSAAWFEITTDSKIVDIRYVRATGQVTHYITKYASKPLTHAVLLDPDRLDEAVRALKGKRLCLTFGTWRGLQLTASLDDDTWIPLGPLGVMIDEAANGDVQSQRILSKLQVQYSLNPRASPHATARVARSRISSQLPLLSKQQSMHWSDI